MITIKDFMEAVNYRITEGSEFLWQCFGPNAHRLDAWDGEVDGYTVSIVFDTKTQEVYQAEAFDYRRKRAYRITHPDYADAHAQEFVTRDVTDVAWEDEEFNDVKFVDLEVDADFLEKARAIVAGEDYDTRVQVEIELDNDLMLAAMRMAHEQDITFNQFLEDLLRTHLEVLAREHE